jgi:Concanavalin A-like lectin/glucanases superfamily
MNANPRPPSAAAVRDGLRAALTFHASFDTAVDADFALGDPRIHHATFPLYADPRAAPPMAAGLGSPPVALAKPGKFGTALAFTGETPRVLCFKALGNLAYAPERFQGSASFWISVEPTAIPQHYADPFQITDKDYNNDCIWVDFTKNDTPPDFRLGVFGDQSRWDPKNQHNLAEEFFWRLLKVAEPPFAAGVWTHVVVAWDGINTPAGGRAALYLDGVLRGKTGVIKERFNWDIGKATIRLGTGPFNGLIDDLALFNRALTADEVGTLTAATGGVAELYRA